ncbi:MAG: FecR domain-containing protein [Marinilabiliaceae bacterium]|nr:FecR domain-containing protein [Marinilabiliaceae bacterium]
MKEDRIWKYIIGEGNDGERLETLRWIKSDAARVEDYHRLKRNYAISGQSSEISDKAIAQSYQVIRRQLDVAPKRFMRFFAVASRYAAVMAFTLIVGWLLFTKEDRFKSQLQGEMSYTTIETLPGQSSKATLPDGTVVWLNSESKLEYSTQFGIGNVRDVKLLGEAFFDVTKDSVKPFQVLTREVTVKVLGTSFNVEAYDGENVATTLVEGKVELDNQAGIKLADLKPGHQAIYSSIDKKVELQEVDTEYYASWKDGYVTFSNVRLEEIAPKLERFYNVDIEFGSERSKNLRINGRAMRNVPVDHLFRVFKVTFGLNYEIQTSFEEKGKIYVY